MAEHQPIHLIGNAHLDPVWLWRWQQGYAEIKATFQSALDRLEEFPDFIFTCSSAAYYQWVEENAPEMFAEIKKRVQEGRWVLAGGWWVQADCNTPCGESFARQALYSQRYFLSRFGKTATFGYNVDSFGHNGMLPQLLKLSGMKHYVFMRPDPNEKDLPAHLFWWESPDGSRIMAYRIPFSYGQHFPLQDKTRSPEQQKLEAIRDLADSEQTPFMGFYGVGNHGGGPTIKSLHNMQDLQKQWGEDKLIFSSPDSYFQEVETYSQFLPVVRDDLQHHASGCYSAHSAIKALNRRAEQRLLAAEKLASLACRMLDLPYPAKQLQQAWEIVLFNQFHDILGGCSIIEAYDDATEAYGEALNLAARVLNSSLQKLAWSIDTMPAEDACRSKEGDWKLWYDRNYATPLVVFNPTAWPAEIPVQVGAKLAAIKEDSGQELPIQQVRTSQTNGNELQDTLFVAALPALGYKVYWCSKEKEVRKYPECQSLKVENTALENDYIRVEWNKKNGYIASCYSKSLDWEMFKGNSAVPKVIDEKECDTWCHNVFTFADQVGEFGDADMQILEKGPLRACIRVTSRYNLSILRQDFYLYHDSAEITVRVMLDWREKYKQLKLAFPVNVARPRPTYEIAYGAITRLANGTEEHGQQWADISGDHAGKQCGLTLINDSKYSYAAVDSELRLTAVRSPLYADHYGQRDGLGEYMDQGIQRFTYKLSPHAGNWQEAEAARKAALLNVPAVHLLETYHPGDMPRCFIGIELSNPAIHLTVYKRAENNRGYIIRLQETAGKEGTADLKLNMLQRDLKDIHFRPQEIRSFFVPDRQDLPATDVDFLEMET